MTYTQLSLPFPPPPTPRWKIKLERQRLAAWSFPGGHNKSHKPVSVLETKAVGNYEYCPKCRHWVRFGSLHYYTWEQWQRNRWSKWHRRENEVPELQRRGILPVPGRDEDGLILPVIEEYERYGRLRFIEADPRDEVR